MTKDEVATSDVAEQLTHLSNSYLASLPAELVMLKNLAVSLNSSESYRTGLAELHYRLHKLSGSGATFGQVELSARARSIEQRVNEWLADSMSNLDEQALRNLIVDLGMLSQTIFLARVSTGASHSTMVERATGDIIRVWLVEDDIQLGQELERQLVSFNFAVRRFSTIEDAESAAQADSTDLLIMDVMLGADIPNATQALTLSPHLKQLSCPLLFISSNDDFQSRVRAAQLGAEGYILKPLDVPRLVTRLLGIFEYRRAPPPRVLIVDDDVGLAAHYRLVLLKAGMEVEVLNSPITIIETILAFRPDLVLMDLYMPEFSGRDLARVIRQYDQWTSLPIVYISTESDIVVQIDAMSRGADDFLTKPILDAQLISAATIRVRRARQLDEQISRDSLTGLLKHTNIKQAVEIEVSRARRSGKPVTIAMLDIDHFKVVNDTYGHGVGDVVISSVAMLLRQRVRQSDILGRYGGEEFVIVFPECDIKTTFQILDDIRQRFSAVPFVHKGKDFTCSFSVGLACSTQNLDGDGAALLIAADEALYAAKQAGRNRVICYDVKNVQH